MNELASTDNVGRYCARNKVTEGGRITAEAFKLWPKDKGYLSANWLEKISQDKEEQIEYLRKYYLEKILKGQPPKKTGAKIACLNVGCTLDFVRNETDDKRVLQFLHLENDSDPSYSGIYGLTIEDDIVCELIAQRVNKSHDL